MLGLVFITRLPSNFLCDPYRNLVYYSRVLAKVLKAATSIIMSSGLPPVTSLPSLPQAEQLRALDTLFEPSPELHKLMAPVLSNQTFSSYSSLIDAVGGRMSALSPQNSPTDHEILTGILGSHPRLGRPKTGDIEHMSELSKREQANLNTGEEEQAEKLRLLNVEYEERFPGLRFVYVLCRSISSHRVL
jgi:2-oxo-4-hydroxy-4-carboxy--5-ureidoimidazoline (OHCU) decarboxylase